MPQKCPCRRQNPLAQMVYLLQGRKVHPNFENKKKFRKIFLLGSTTTRKTRWIHRWNPFSNPLTINGDICNFVTAVSALSNRSQRCVYNYARRPILRTGQHLPCAAFSSCYCIAVPLHNYSVMVYGDLVFCLPSLCTSLVKFKEFCIYLYMHKGCLPFSQYPHVHHSSPIFSHPSSYKQYASPPQQTAADGPIAQCHELDSKDPLGKDCSEPAVDIIWSFTHATHSTN